MYINTDGLPSLFWDIFLIVIVVITFFLAFKYCFLYRKAASFKQVDAKIIKCEIKQSNVNRWYEGQFKVQYQYSFQGQTYISSRIRLEDLLNGFFSQYEKNIARRVKRSFDEGKQIQVWVDTENPVFSLISNSLDKKSIAFLLGIGFSALLTLLLELYLL